jgi:hypothetical protein
MPRFDAASVGDVEYDFTGFKGTKGSIFAGVPIQDRGEIPEPSPDMVSRTMSRITGAFKKMDLGEIEETPEAIAAALNKVDDEQTFKLMADELLDAVAELCDGAPRRESLEALGWRRFMAFLGYVMGELMSPEVLKNDTSTTQGRLRSV